MSRIVRVLVNDRVPQIFNMVTDPVGAGVVQSMEASGGNISGISSEVPLRVQLQGALEVVKFQKLGLLFNPREKNSMLVREELQTLARELQFEVIDLRAPPAQDMLQAQLQQLATQSIPIDAVYLPPDSFLASNAPMIGAQLRLAKIKTIGAVKPFIDHGALLGVVAAYYDLGQMAAGCRPASERGAAATDPRGDGDTSTAGDQ